MATSFLLLTSALMAILTISHHHCNTAQDKNPQKMVEIIELMLSQRPNDSDKKAFGIQKVPQEDAPNYEILITPNKNLQELKGSQKIKIFVEAANFEPEDKQMEKKKLEEAEKREKHKIFDVVPLSIETVGLNIKQYQQSALSGVKLNNHDDADDIPQKDFESYPSKRQTNWNLSPAGKTDLKEVAIQPSYVDQNNPYHPLTPKKDERRVGAYDGDYPAGGQTGKRVQQQTYVEEFAAEETGRPRPAPKEPKRAYDEPYEETRPSKSTYNRPNGGRSPVYEREKEDEEGEEEEEKRQVYGREPEGRPATYESDARKRGQEERPQDNRERPVREDSGYSGFPESHNLTNLSRPLVYKPPRAFPASPCLDVFKYEGREPEEDRWYGDIYVTTDETLNGLRLDIRLDRPADILANWVAEVKTKDSMHFTLLSLTHRLVPGPPETVKIMVKFDEEEPVPYLKSINLNGRLICPGRTQKTTTKRPVYENPADLHLNTKRTTEPYQEGPKRPVSFVEEYESNTKRTTSYTERRPTTQLEDNNRKITTRPSHEYLRPNPNGYEETSQNNFDPPPKKPPGRPSHSNGKPPPHAAKPAQGSRPPQSPPGQSGNKHSQQSGNRPSPPPFNTNRPPSPPSNGNNRPPQPPPNTNIGPSGDSQSKQILCGLPSVQPRPLITHGQLTARGQWPWHVALYKNVGTDLTFFCGGSLINYNYVVTAAHCVTKTYTTKPLDENVLVVYLGKYHLKLWSEGGVQNRQVSKIYVHPKYNSTDFKSDIAVLALSSPVEYTDYIRPICLWDRTNTRIEDLEGREGTVVGWGFDETKKLTEELRQAKMPVVEQKTCLWSYPEFYPQFTSNLTYCAGFRNGTSVCNGDSGGGMVFPYRDGSGVERWHLRGIVSISPARNDSKVCDPTHYVVFTDVAKFLPWLDNFV